MSIKILMLIFLYATMVFLLLFLIRKREFPWKILEAHLMYLIVFAAGLKILDWIFPLIFDKPLFMSNTNLWNLIYVLPIPVISAMVEDILNKKYQNKSENKIDS